jgi:Thioesterase-like superfamily
VSAAALHIPDGDRFVPGPLTAGPWDPAAQHGGPPAALLTRAVETVGAPAPVRLARATFELLRPVPLVPLTVATTVLRNGRRVQLVQASLQAGGTEVMRVTALRIRRRALELPEGTAADGAPPLPDGPTPSAFPGERDDLVAYHNAGVELRFVEGGFDRPGRATAWCRLRVPVVAGEEPTPAMRTMAAADFGNGFSWVLPRDRWLFVNPDLSVHLARPPEGPWVCLRSDTVVGPEGVAVAHSTLYDVLGPIGTAVQSLFVEPRASAG